MNRGNTGQHWKMSRLQSVKIADGKVWLTLTCGHSFSNVPSWGTLEEDAEWSRARIGKRQACNECSKAVSS